MLIIFVVWRFAPEKHGRRRRRNPSPDRLPFIEESAAKTFGLIHSRGGISNFFEKVGDKFRGGDGDLTQSHDDEERSKRDNEMREKGEATRKKIEAEKEKDAIAEAKGEEKIKLLLAENTKLHEQEANLSKLSSEYQEDEYQAGKNNAEIKKILVEESKKLLKKPQKRLSSARKSLMKRNARKKHLSTKPRPRLKRSAHWKITQRRLKNGQEPDEPAGSGERGTIRA